MTGVVRVPRRFRFLAALVPLLVVVACGSEESASLFPGGGDDGGGGGLLDATVPPDFGDGGGTVGDGGADGHITPVGCTPRTCVELHASSGIDCGPQGDGCGGTLECGTCAPPATCGGGGTSSVCGGNGGCKPKTCTDLGASCGQQGDGCGGVLDCGTCTAPATCGGGATANACGGTSGCVPKTCAQQGIECGKAGDTCGNVIDCGVTVGGVPNQCANGASCGSGGPSKCATGPVDGGTGDGGSSCVAKTCTQLGATCGQQGNGCGGILNCGTCAAPKTCGGGGTANACGGTSACVPKTCAALGKNCGPVGDGCGGVAQCGNCTAPTICGGGGTASVCGGNVTACVPKTCAQLGANCGPVGNGCGGLLQCGTCSFGDVCGGGGTASVCGGGVDGGADAGCTGLCLNQAKCDGGATTTLTGTVFAPNAIEQLYGAAVYVPNGPLSPFTEGVSCDRCGALVSGLPLVKAFTGTDGKFTLNNVPAGVSFPLVIQLGRWRITYTIPAMSACTSKDIAQFTPSITLRLPRNQTEGDIPKTAIVTGDVDTLECVLRNMGLDDSEFSGSNRNGRVHIYQGNTRVVNGVDHYPADAPRGTTLSHTALWTDPTTLNKYDLVFLACEGFAANNGLAARQALRNYVNIGGRLYATHYQYTWLASEDPFKSTASWDLDQGHLADPNTITASIDTSFPKGDAFSKWLGTVGALASVSPPQISLNVSRHDIDTTVAATSQRWISSASTNSANRYPNAIQHYTFNTPTTATPDNQCGRVLFSDFHVNNADVNGATFPDECGGRRNLTAQEKVLEFFFFDLAQCIEPDKPPTCTTKKTCVQLGATCGTQGDGCGGTLDCGTCVAPQSCGGGGTPNKCGGSSCTPITCAAQGVSCGPAGNGCGGQLDCGACVPPQTCGGGGVSGKCGNPTCIAKTCAQLGVSCGPAGDGCGGLLACGACTKPGDSCGGGGSAGVCGQGTCKPTTCAVLEAGGDRCGFNADGCGGVVDCGDCTSGKVCGGGTAGANKCGPGTCTPKTCAQLNSNCGLIGDGCGGQLDCGSCPLGQSCGGAGTSNTCGNPCTPKTCSQQGISCGPAGDGCGGAIDCGGCAAPDTCGGGGTQFECGHPIIH